MKRVLCILLACLLLCGLAVPMASAAEKTITSVEAAGDNVFDYCIELGIWTSVEVSVSLLVRYSDGSASNVTQPLWVNTTGLTEGLHEYVGYYQPDESFEFTFFINAISVRNLAGAEPLRLNVPQQVIGSKLECFSYTPEKTGWVNIAVAPPAKNQYGSCSVFDEACGRIGDHINSGSNVTVKMTAGKTYYLAVISPPANTAITLSASEPPVLQKDELKFRTTFSGGDTFRPFQQGYFGVPFTVNGEAAPANGFSYSRANTVSVYISPNTPAGTYVLRFSDCDGEDLGTLTVILEDFKLIPEGFTLRGWLEDFLTGLQADWANDDKTTGEWLKSVGKDFLLMFASPAIAFAIFCMGPMGWVFLPVAFLPFTQLFFDIGGLISSIFR